MIELVLGLTILVTIMAIGYKALLSISRQQTSAANKAARLQIANSVRNAVVDYFGKQEEVRDGTQIKSVTVFDRSETTGRYYLKYDPADKVADAIEKDHLTINRDRKTETPDFSTSKFKVTVDIDNPAPPIFDRRVVVTVRNTEQAKGGPGYEEESFEYFLVKPRPSISGGSVTLTVRNGNDGPGTDDDPDGVNGTAYGAGLRRITASIIVKVGGVPTGEVRQARSSADGQIRIYGLPLDEVLEVTLDGSNRGELIPYYSRNCYLNKFPDVPNNTTLNSTEVNSCQGDPSSVWFSNFTRTIKFTSSADVVLEDQYLWPYARVTGAAIDYDSGAPIRDVGMHLVPVHVEIPSVETFTTAYIQKTKGDGTYSFNLVPGFYYRASYGSVAENYYTGAGHETPIHDPDRRALPHGVPNTDRNNDSLDTHPYGLVDSVGTSHPAKYPAVVLPNETDIARLNPAPANPAQSDYPTCFFLRPGVSYSRNTGRANNPLNTFLRLRPIGDYKATLRLAQWDNTLARFESAAVQTPLTTYAGDLILNVFNNMRKSYMTDEAIYTSVDAPHVNADGTYIGNRMYPKITGFESLTDGEGVIASGRLSASGPSMFGDVPFMGASFFNGDYGVLEATQFRFSSYLLPFPSGWVGPLTPILIMTNQANLAQQLYVFWHGIPDFNDPALDAPNGRADGVLFTVNPSRAFQDETFWPTWWPYATTSPTPFPPWQRQTVIAGQTGIDNSFTDNAVHPYAWFRKAMRADLNGPNPAASPSPLPLHVLPLTQLATVRGRIINPDGTPFFVSGLETTPLKLSTWGVEYVPDSNPAAATQSFVNFNYDNAFSVPQPAASPSPLHSYEISRVIPTMETLSIARGNGRQIIATLAQEASVYAVSSYNLGRFYKKMRRATGTPEFYFDLAGMAEVSIGGGPDIYLTNAARAIIPSSTGFTPGPSVTYEDGIGSGIFYDGPHHRITLNQVYRGESKLFQAKAGQATQNADTDIIMDPVNTTTELPPTLYVRMGTTSRWIDARAPDAGLLGVPSIHCAGAPGNPTCDWFPDAVALGSPFYGSSDNVIMYRRWQFGTVRVTVTHLGAPVVGKPVSMFTSSLRKYRLPVNNGNFWELKCTALTDSSGVVDFTSINPADCTNAGHPATAFEIKTFDGFATNLAPVDANDSGVKNVHFEIENISGQANPCPPGSLSTCAYDGANNHHIIQTFDFVPLPSVAPASPTGGL